MGELASGTLLVIGIHREELAFGEHVAELLQGSPIQVLRIERGLSNKKPLPDEQFYYHIRHRELYLQIRDHVKGHYHMVVDLHSGVNEPGRCVDAFCHRLALLDCLRGALSSELLRYTRLIQIAEQGKGGGSEVSYPVSHTVVPECVFASPRFCYVCVEVYLPHLGIGQRQDWEYTRDLTMAIHKCGQVCE